MPINEKLSFIQLEQLMQTPPQFQPQHCGIVIQSRAESPPGSFMEAMIKTVSSVKYLPFSVEDKSLDIQVRIAEIDTEFKRILGAISAENAESFNEVRMTELMYEKQNLQQQLSQIAGREQKRKNAKSRLDEIFTILDGLENHPMEYDDSLVRQLMECIVVENKEKIKIVFVGGLEVEQTLE